MKKISIIAFFATLILSANAAVLFEGSHAITWETPLNLEKEKFADAKAGDKIVVTYTNASENIEFKVLEVWNHIAGSREAAGLDGSKDSHTFEQFLTTKAVEQIKANGLQIVGKTFTCTKVELLDGKTLKAGTTVWTGFFWADNYTTLELYADGYNYVDFSTISALRIYSEAGRSDIVINIKETREDAGNIANIGDMTAGEGYMELPLTDELRTRLANASHWMVQFNKEEGNPFNVTDIVLVPKTNTTALENIVVESNTIKTIENGQIVIIKDNVRYNVLGVKL